MLKSAFERCRFANPLCYLFLAMVMLIITSCGGGGGGGGGGAPAGNVTSGVTGDAGTLQAAAGFPVLVDPQGVFMYAVKATPGAIYACYVQSGSPYLMLARSEDNGASWHYGRIDFGGVFASLAVDGDNVYVGYIDQSWKTLKFARSGDRGNTWQISEVDDSIKSDPATRPADPAQPYLPDDFKYTAMARSGDSFFIAYYDRVHSSLRLARSDDRGASWALGTLDNSDGNDGDSPSIAIDGRNIYISYVGVTGQGQSARDSVNMMVSADAGSTWRKRLVAATAYATGYYTSVAAKGNLVHVSYFNALERKLMLARSVDYGAAWAIRTVDSTDNAGRYSSLSLGQGVMDLCYGDWTNNSLKLARSYDDGNSWTVKTLTVNADSGSPAFASVLGNELYVLFFSRNSSQPAMFGAMLTKFAN